MAQSLAARRSHNPKVASSNLAPGIFVAWKTDNKMRKESTLSFLQAGGVTQQKSDTFSICACHPCAGAMLIFSVSFQFYRMRHSCECSEHPADVTIMYETGPSPRLLIRYTTWRQQKKRSTHPDSNQGPRDIRYFTATVSRSTNWAIGGLLSLCCYQSPMMCTQTKMLLKFCSSILRKGGHKTHISCLNTKKKRRGPTETWTRITRIRTWGANQLHYRTTDVCWCKQGTHEHSSPERLWCAKRTMPNT